MISNDKVFSRLLNWGQGDTRHSFCKLNQEKKVESLILSIYFDWTRRRTRRRKMGLRMMRLRNLGPTTRGGWGGEESKLLQKIY